VDNQDRYILELNTLFRENGCVPDENQIERLAYYADLIVEKNQFINLISRKDAKFIIENHIFISAFVARFLPDKFQSFIDIGTGGGFPGIPLAILRPQMEGVLVDSTQKKITAVSEFISRLMLGNITAENQRVESSEFLQKYENQFDLVVSRATVPLTLLLRYSIPLIKNKAVIASIKGGDLKEEIKEAENKFRPYIRKTTVFELSYKPTNKRNEKEKRLILMELNK